MTATLTHALADLRRLAGTLVAAEIARRAAALREAEKIAATVAAEYRRTREMLAAFREAQEQELAAVLAETASLAGPSAEKGKQPKSDPPRPTPIGSHPYAPSLPITPETEQPAPQPEPPPTLDEGDPVAAENAHWERIADGRLPADGDGQAAWDAYRPDNRKTPSEPQERQAVTGDRRLTDALSDGWTADEDAEAGVPLGVPAAGHETAAEVPVAATNGKRPHKRKRGA